MNFFDFELSRTATATPPQSAEELSGAPEPTLNEEVSQVVGQLGRLWGGFRKQSQVALESARKDFTSVVSQAQKEIEKLTAEPIASSSRTAADIPQDSGTSSGDAGAPSSSSAEGDAPPHTEPLTFQALLSRVQASIPPNLSATLEHSLPDALRDPAAHVNVDFAALRTTLGAEFARVQGVTRAQAEEYAHRSEVLLRDAGAYIKEAVKVIPPEDGGETDVMFDGMGTGVIVMPPSLNPSKSGNAEFSSGPREKGKGKETAAQAQRRLAGSRAAAMLAQLKRDPEVVKQDPLEDNGTKELYEAWVKDEVMSKEGGIEAAFWSERIKSLLVQKEDGEILRSTRDALVPAVIESNTFWMRYFFRVHQIEKDEEKRKALLAASGSAENDEDFSWEDDEEESATPSATSSVSPTKGKPQASPGMLDKAHESCDTLQPGDKMTAPSSYPSSLVTSPSSTSPRESSDGYDVVSASTENVTNVKTKALKEARKPEETDEEEEEDGDSDWE
ncbi:hypothetical protein M0805_001676 [Coniferiporia weirii]|nr:hypothetical protein M0805_001676 [Coniferiporia weirii]